MSDNIPLIMNNKRIKSTQKPKKHKPDPFFSCDKARRKQNNNKPSYTSDNDSIKSSESDEKALADVAVDGYDVAGEDVEETVGEKRKRAAVEYLERIPFNIQEEIIKILPIKSLVRFRLVSRQWKSLIDSSKFIVEYHTHQKHKHHLLVNYQLFGENFNPKYVSIIDDDTFPQHKVSLTVPRAFPLIRKKVVSSQGLLFGHRYEVRSGTTKSVINIWNPAIRKSVDICVPDSYPDADFGFGVCPDTYDPKIVKYKFYCGKREFEIFTLSTIAWRRLSKNLPRECISFTCDNQVAIDRFMYWLAGETINEQNVYGTRMYTRNLIVSFDMTSEEFTEISFPASLAERSTLHLYNISDTLVVVQLKHEAKKPVYSVWKMMEHGVSKSFTKLYTINTTDVIEHVYGFRKSGEPIVEMEKDLFAYDPDSKHINIGIYGTEYRNYVKSYIETLLLLDH